MSSSVPCPCSATLKLISTRQTPSSFSSAGALLNPPGISSSLISSSRNSGIDSPFFLYHQHRGSDQRPTRNPAPQQRWLLPFRRYLEAETRAGDLCPRGRSVAKSRSFHLGCASST